MKKIIIGKGGRFSASIDTDTFEVKEIDYMNGIDYMYLVDEECDVTHGEDVIHVTGRCVLIKTYSNSRNGVSSKIIPVYNDELYEFAVSYNSRDVINRKDKDECYEPVCESC